MKGLCFTNPCGYLLGFYGCNLCWANKKAIQKVKGEVLKGLGFIFGVRIFIVSGVISVQSGHIRQLNYVLVEDIHLAQGLNADTKSLRWLLFRQAEVVRINMLRSNIKRLSIHRPRSFIPSHLPTLVCLSEKTGNAFRNMLAKFDGGGGDANWVTKKPIGSHLRHVSIVSLGLKIASHWSSPFVNRESSAVSTCAYKFVLTWIILPHRRLAMNIMDNVLGAAPNTVSNEKRHYLPPEYPCQKLIGDRQHAQGGAA